MIKRYLGNCWFDAKDFNDVHYKCEGNNNKWTVVLSLKNRLLPYNLEFETEEEAIEFCEELIEKFNKDLEEE